MNESADQSTTWASLERKLTTEDVVLLIPEHMDVDAASERGSRGYLSEA